MQTYSFISQKGGAGKSTLARQLSVLAGVSEPALLIDRDPQETTTKWWGRRQDLKTYDRPDLLTLEPSQVLTSAVDALRRAPGKLFIDTRPQVQEPEAEVARVSDLIIVPVRTSPDDLEAVEDTLRMIRRQNKRAVIVVNAAKNRARAVAAQAALSRWPFAVCPHYLTDRAVYQDAHLEGQGVGETQTPAGREALAELARVWAWIQEETAHG